MPALIFDLLSRHGISPRRVSSAKGGEYASPCPSCGGDDRFRVWPEQNEGEGSWWCRRCDRGGDCIQLLIDVEGLSYPAAARQLGKEVADLDRAQYRTPAPQQAAARSWTPSSSASPQEKWAAKATAFLEWSRERLQENPEVLAWLAARGIPEASELGWNPGEKGRDLFRAREAWGLPTEWKGDRKKKLWLPQGLVIPRHDAEGQLYQLRIRRPEGEPRYYVVPGSGMAPLLMGPDRRAFVVVEADLDGRALFAAAGDLVGVLVLGNSTAKPDAAADAVLQEAASILVALDFDGVDDRGRRPGHQAWLWWRENYREAVRWPVPSGKDPGEAFAAGVDLRSWILAGLPPAWTIGRSVSPKKGEGGERGLRPEPKEEKAEPAMAPGGVPAVLREAFELLRDFQCAVDLRGGGMALVTTQRLMRQEEKWRRLSRLVFFDELVFAHLARHPAPVVSGENFWEKPREVSAQLNLGPSPGAHRPG